MIVLGVGDLSRYQLQKLVSWHGSSQTFSRLKKMFAPTVDWPGYSIGCIFALHLIHVSPCVVRAIAFLRFLRHHARRPPPATIKPGELPAPTMGPGTATGS